MDLEEVLHMTAEHPLVVEPGYKQLVVLGYTPPVVPGYMPLVVHCMPVMHTAEASGNQALFCHTENN